MTRIVFCTGRSDAGRAALSPVQRAFGEALARPAGARLWRSSFPYDAPAAWRPVGLLRASAANAREVLAARRPGFRDAVGRRVRDAIVGPEPALVLAGSCGLELLARSGALREGDPVRVVAYGPAPAPVALPPVPVTAVIGRRDLLARALWRGPAERADCGHLDYLTDPALLRIARRELAQLEREHAPDGSRCRDAP